MASRVRREGASAWVLILFQKQLRRLELKPSYQAAHEPYNPRCLIIIIFKRPWKTEEDDEPPSGSAETTIVSWIITLLPINSHLDRKDTVLAASQT